MIFLGAEKASFSKKVLWLATGKKRQEGLPFLEVSLVKSSAGSKQYANGGSLTPSEPQVTLLLATKR
jgi:hypothetical protein